MSSSLSSSSSSSLSFGPSEVTSAATEAALEIAFNGLSSAVEKLIKKNLDFGPTLEGLAKTLKSMKPTVDRIAALNKKFGRPDEIEGLMELMQEGRDLVDKCKNISKFNIAMRPIYTDKLGELDAKIARYINFDLQIQSAVVQRETLFGVKSGILVATETFGAVKRQGEVGKEILTEVRQQREVERGILDALEKLNNQVKPDSNHNSLKSFFGGCSPPELRVVPVGLQTPLLDLKRKLLEKEAPLVVLSAPGGCGKTTLATAFCHDSDVKEKFKHNIFYIIVSRRTSLERIVRKLFKYRGFEVPQFQNHEALVYHLEQFFKGIGQPILLVLDDVWPESESLLENLKFPIHDYKVLVTSRSVFPRFGSTQKLEPLNDEDAMTLFSNASLLRSRSSDIPDKEVVEKIVKECKGFPMALNLVGRSLCGQSSETWKTREIELCKGNLLVGYGDLQSCLQRSLDALDNKVIKECFMDLCSFPEDQRIPVTALIDMWVELYNLDKDGMAAVANLHELSNRNLIDLVVRRKQLSGSYNQHFVMQHDLLRELAMQQTKCEPVQKRKRIIYDVNESNFSYWRMEQQSPTIGDRLWSLARFFWWQKQEQQRTNGRLLSISTSDDKFPESWYTTQGTEVKVLVLNCWAKNYILPEFIQEMQKLKVLVLTNYSYLPAELSNFTCLGAASNLTRIRLEKVSIPPFGFTSTQLKNVQKITLVLCDIGQAFSTSALHVSDALPNLLEINIDYCDDLQTLPVELCWLTKLKKLSITDCHNLTTLPEELGNLVDLEMLRLSSCIELSGLPDTIDQLHKLRILDISECPEIKSLPEGFGDLQKLEKLHMMWCSRDCDLPQSIVKLKQLVEVTCDEETAMLWAPFSYRLKDLSIKVQKEEHSLDSLRF